MDKPISQSSKKEITELFESMVQDGQWHGGQLAVCHSGELVLELAGGVDGQGNPVRLDSILCILSTTKMLTSMVMHMIHDRGVYDYDDRVAKYWPEFAQNGKEEITIRQVLSHRSGLAPAAMAGYRFWREWTKPNGVRQLIEDMKPVWPPGSANGYHAHTYGQVLDELIQIWTKKNTGQFLRDEICKPLGIQDVYLGMPENVWKRYAPFVEPPGADLRREKAPEGGAGHFFNSYHIMKQCLAWGSGAARARDLARLANVFAYKGTYGGKTFFSEDTFNVIVKPNNAPDFVDRVLLAKGQWGLGVLVGTTEGTLQTRGALYGETAPKGTCGHLGGNSSLTWADPHNRMTMSFISTGTKGRVTYQSLSDAVRRALI